MGIFDKLTPYKDEINKSLDIVDQKVEDKDLVNRIKQQMRELEHQMRLAELSIKTVPWIDALHKIGRQLLSFFSIVAIVVLKLMDIDLSLEEVAALGGPTIAYNLIKGKGK